MEDQDRSVRSSAECAIGSINLSPELTPAVLAAFKKTGVKVPASAIDELVSLARDEYGNKSSEVIEAAFELLKLVEAQRLP